MNVFLSNPGVVCACGSELNDIFDSLTSGKQSGIKKIECRKNENEDVKKEFFVGKVNDKILSSTNDKYDMRLLQILDVALNKIEGTVKKAIEKFGKERVGVCLGSCDNGSELSFKAHKEYFTTGKFPADYNLKIQGADYPATFTKNKFGLKGLALSFSTACSSSASAIVKAREFIEAGILDAVVVGGVDVVSNTVLLGFDSLEAVSSEIANPMSKNRHGITLGEGAAFFVLSKEDLDSTYIKLLGCGESSDASHMTAPLKDGSGAIQAMTKALNDAKLSPKKIDYVSLHATGTKLNDSMESQAVAEVFKNHSVYVSGTKSMTGHTLGASGALELAICFLAIQNEDLPPHINDGVQDEELPKLNLVPKTLREKSDSNGYSSFENKVKICMSNSFAFGGCNVSLIIGETNEN